VTTLNDLFGAPTALTRPDHADFWKLSGIILALKADKEDCDRGRIDMAEFERRWRAHYAAVGDFDSIAYCAVQAALAIQGIETVVDWFVVLSSPAKHEAYVGSLQAYFDGFIMGALLERKRTA